MSDKPQSEAEKAAAAKTAGGKPARRPRTPSEGTLIAFRIVSESELKALQAAADHENRTVHNMAHTFVRNALKPHTDHS